MDSSRRPSIPTTAVGPSAPGRARRVASSIGPCLGGWLIDAISWRLVFLINVPLAATAIAIAVRHVPDTRFETHDPLDIPGAALGTTALATISYAAIEYPDSGAVIAAVVGVVALVAFVTTERTSRHPMLPLSLVGHESSREQISRPSPHTPASAGARSCLWRGLARGRGLSHTPRARTRWPSWRCSVEVGVDATLRPDPVVQNEKRQAEDSRGAGPATPALVEGEDHPAVRTVQGVAAAAAIGVGRRAARHAAMAVCTRP